MSNNIEFGIRFTGDSRGLTSAVSASETQLRRFGEVGRDAGRDIASGQQKAREGIDASAAAIERLSSKLGAMGHLTAAYFSVDAIYSQAKEIALLAARYETLEVSMHKAGNNAGYTRAEMDRYQASLEKTGISMMESRNTLIQMSAANMDLANSTKLARAAQDLAVVGNMNSSEAFNNLVYGIKSGQIEVLRTIGLNVSFEESYKKLGAQLHKNAADLSESEKLQARTNTALEAAAKYQGIYEEAMGTAGKQINSLARYQENYKIILGETFNESLAFAVGAYTTHLKESNAAAMDLKEKGDLKEWGRDAALVLAGVGDAARMVGNTLIVIGTSSAQITAAAALMIELPIKALQGKGNEAIASYRAVVASLRETQTNAISGMADNLKLTNAVNDGFAEMEKKKANRLAKSAADEADYVQKARAISAVYINDQKNLKTALTALANSYGGDIAARLGNQNVDAPVTSKRDEAAAKAHAKWMADEAAKITILNAEADTQEKLTEAQKRIVQMSAEQENALTRLTPKIYAERVARLSLVAVGEQQKNQADAEKKYRDQLYSEYEKHVSALVSEADSIRKKADQQEFENSKIGKSAEEIARLTEARYNEQIAALSTTLYTLDAANACTAESEAIREKITQIARLRDAESAKPVIKADASLDKFMSDNVAQSMTDGIMKGFENGKGFAQNFTDSFANMIKTQVIDTVVKGTMAQMMSSLTAPSTGDKPASATGIGEASPYITAAVVAYSVGAEIVRGLSTDTSRASAAQQQSIEAAMRSASIESALKGLESNSNPTLTYTREMTGYLRNISTSISANMGGLQAIATPTFNSVNTPALIKNDATVVGALLGGLTGGLSANRIASWMGTTMNQTDAGLQVSGTGQNWQAKKYQDITITDTHFFGNSETRTDRNTFGLGAADNKMLSNVFDSMTKSVEVAARSMGVAITGQLDQVPRDFSVSLQGLSQDAQYKALEGALAGVGDRLAKAGVSGLEGYAKANEKYFETVVRVAKETDSFSQALGNMSQSGKVSITTAVEIGQSLAQMSGGMDKLLSNMAGYQANYMSAAERSAAALANVNTAMSGFGVETLPRTREEFRKLVEAQNLASPAGQAMYASLLSVQQAFADAVPATEALTVAVKSQAQIATERADWQNKLDVLTGAKTQQQIDRSAALSGVTDSVTLAIMHQVYAQQDLAAATANTAAAEKAAADKAKAIADQRISLENQLAILTGAKTQQQIDRAGQYAGALDVTATKLLDQIHAQQDLTAAANDAATALKAQSDAQKNLTSTYSGLLKAQGHNDAALQVDLTAAQGAYNDALKGVAKEFGVGVSAVTGYIAKYGDIGAAGVALYAQAAKDGVVISTAQTNAISAAAAAQTAVLNAQGAISSAAKAASDKAIADAKASADAASTVAKQQADAATAAAQKSAQDAAQLAQTKQQWQDQLDVLTGARTQQQIDRARQLAAVTDASTLAIMRQVYAQQDASKAATDAAAAAQKSADESLKAAQSATTNAMSALQRAVDAQKKSIETSYTAHADAIKKQADASKQGWQTQVDAASKSADSIRTIYNSLQSTLSGLSAPSYSEAQATLSAALAHSNSGGGLVGFAGLESALSAVGKQGQDQYTSVAEMQHDAAVTRGILDGLKTNAAGQLSVADLTLNAVKSSADIAAKGFDEQLKMLDAQRQQDIAGLDAQMTAAQRQLDALNGIDKSVISVSSAIGNLAGALNAQAAATAAATAAAKAAAVQAVPVSAPMPAAAATGFDYMGYANKVARGGVTGAESAAAQSAGYLPADVYAKVLAKGGQQYANVSTVTDLYSAAKMLGIPGFAAGGFHAGGLRLVGENGPELEVTGPSRIISNRDVQNIFSGGAGINTQQLEKLVIDLTAEVQSLQAIVANGNYLTQRVADAVNGRPDQPMLVEVVA